MAVGGLKRKHVGHSRTGDLLGHGVVVGRQQSLVQSDLKLSDPAQVESVKSPVINA